MFNPSTALSINALTALLTPSANGTPAPIHGGSYYVVKYFSVHDDVNGGKIYKVSETVARTKVAYGARAVIKNAPPKAPSTKANNNVTVIPNATTYNTNSKSTSLWLYPSPLHRSKSVYYDNNGNEIDKATALSLYKSKPQPSNPNAPLNHFKVNAEQILYIGKSTKPRKKP